MLRAVLERGIRTSPLGPGVTPGGVLAYGDQHRHVATLAFGRSHLPNATLEPDHPAVFDVTADTVYDLASVTKPMATAAAFMKLDIDPAQPARSLLPELSGTDVDRVTFAHLLGHTSGFPAHLKFYERILAGQRPGGATSARDALYQMVVGTERCARPGTTEIYSDLGYIALGVAIERATGERLDRAVSRLVLQPLGLDSTFFVDLTEEPRQPKSERVAPTEVCPYRGLVHREVHDDNAHAAGGICGHAGLFATADDVARFGRAMLTLLDGRAIGGFQPEVARRFARTATAPGATHTLGWDRPSPPPVLTHAGARWPLSGVGHLGFTGTSLWLDPARGRYVVLLTNRVHPSRQPPGIRDFRRAVMDAVVAELDD